MQKQRKNCQTRKVNIAKTTVQPQSIVLALLQRIYITNWHISLSCSAETKTTTNPHPHTHTQVEGWGHLLTPDWLEPEDWWLRFWKHHLVTSSPTNQKKIRELIPSSVQLYIFSERTLNKSGVHFSRFFKKARPARTQQVSMALASGKGVLALKAYQNWRSRTGSI